MRALLFDSGVGGLSVLGAMARAGLDLTCDFIADSAWLPYGDKPAQALSDRVTAILRAASLAWEPSVVILACNTASTIALEAVRAALPMPVIVTVPPIKPAAEATRSGVIGLLATPATIARPFTQGLIDQFASNCRVIRVGSAQLVQVAEAKLRGEEVDSRIVRAVMGQMFDAPGGQDLDVIALACTHFPLLRQELESAAPRAISWIDSGEAIARRVAVVCGLDLPGPGLRLGRVGFTGEAHSIQSAFGAFGFQSFARITQENGEFSLAPCAMFGAG